MHKRPHHIYYLPTGCTLELFEQMQENNTWKSSGFAIGSPTHKLSSELADGTATLDNQIELTSAQAATLCDFLSMQKNSVHHGCISEWKVGSSF